jgi:hypothetical protein
MCLRRLLLPDHPLPILVDLALDAADHYTHALPSSGVLSTRPLATSAHASQLSNEIPDVLSVSGGFHTSPDALLSGMSRDGPRALKPLPLKKLTSGWR